MDIGYGYILGLRRRRRRRIPLYRRILAVRENAFDLPDEAFIALFRLPKRTVQNIINLVSEDLSRPTNRHQAVPVGVQVLVSMRLLASGSFQNVVGESLYHRIRQPTVSKVFASFLNSFIRYIREFIVFPTTADQIRNTKLGFQEKFQFPGCLGCIDGTHITVVRPVEHWNAYLNRKGKFTLNVQMVCDSTLRITDVVAQWPGSTHDSYIYHNCGLRTFLHSAECPPNTWLLGDKGYPLEHCLLTPIRIPQNDNEERYNVSHRHCRNTIERAFGVLKMVWRIMHDSGGVLLYQPEKVVKIVVCCVMLHNIRINEHLPVEYDENFFPEEDEQDFYMNNFIDNINQRRGEAVRQRLINNMFNM